MKISDRQKDFLASIGVGLLSMILFVLLMGTVVMWGQNAGQRVRAQFSNGTSQTTTANDSANDSAFEQ